MKPARSAESAEELRLKPTPDLLGHDISRDGDVCGPVQALLNVQGKRADEVWTAKEYAKLALHLHNGNELKRFVMGFRSEHGKEYVRSKKVNVLAAIAWSWDTIRGRGKLKMAFAPYSVNKDGMSRWGALDFDAHDGSHERARQFAFGAFGLLLNSELVLILERTGGGWHLWAIAKGFHPVNEWIRLLKSVAHKIGAPIRDGVCEIFPPDSLSSGFGKPMRAPGSWNPSTDSCNEVLWENSEALLDDLPEMPVASSRKPPRRVGDLPEREKEDSFSSSPSSLPVPLYRAVEFLSKFAITQPSTRNELLGKLIGHVFHQVGMHVAKGLAEAQYQAKTVATKASLMEHLEAFQAYWRGMEEKWKATLSEDERRHFGQLGTDSERDAFRIIWSFKRKADMDGHSDFPIVRRSLAERLALTESATAGILDKFVVLSIIHRTREYVPNKTAARYRWLLAGGVGLQQGRPA